ncbi:unnamed protein product [Urochloa humidicola]
MDPPNPTRLAALLPLRAAVFFILASLLASTAAAHNDVGLHKNYLIIVRTPYEYDRSMFKDVSSWHASLLASVCDMAEDELNRDPSAMARLIYSYRHVVNGFAARLTDEEVRAMSTMDWFVKAMPEKTYRLMTTHTPQMLGLAGDGGLWKTSVGVENLLTRRQANSYRAQSPAHPGKAQRTFRNDTKILTP